MSSAFCCFCYCYTEYITEQCTVVILIIIIIIIIIFWIHFTCLAGVAAAVKLLVVRLYIHWSSGARGAGGGGLRSGGGCISYHPLIPLPPLLQGQCSVYICIYIYIKLYPWCRVTVTLIFNQFSGISKSFLVYFYTGIFVMYEHLIEHEQCITFCLVMYYCL